MADMDDWIEENLTPLEDDFYNAADVVTIRDLDYISDKTSDPSLTIPKDNAEPSFETLDAN